MKRTPLRRKSKSPLRKLKDELWQLCREIIFARYEINGHVFCYTCGIGPLEGANRHLGHFIPSSISSVEMRYDLDNLRPQCFMDNIHRSGNWPAFEKNLKKEKGDDFVEKLKQRNEETKGRQYDMNWYKDKIAEYSNL